MTNSEFIREMTEMMLNNYEKINANTEENKERNSTLHALYVSLFEAADKRELQKISSLLMHRFQEFGEKLLKNSTEKYQQEFKKYEEVVLDEGLLSL